jgi:hypothetical protein
VLCIVDVLYFVRWPVIWRRDDLESTGKVGISSGESDGSWGDEEWIIVDIKVHVE